MGDKKPIRRRATHTRSRLGCETCRVRRVRCDQTKPVCLKCSKTGRSCDGYTTTAPTHDKRRLVAVPQNPSLSIVVDENELRCMHYFQSHTAPQFADFFDSDLWCRLVFQVSTREPCIRHNIIALGSLHEAFHDVAYCTASSTRWFDLKEYASVHYTKAITLLNADISSQGWASLDVSLLCCILCIGFEWLRGSFASAQIHLANGLRVLQQWLRGDSTQSRGTGISLSSPTGHFIRNKLVPLYTRLSLQAKTFANIPLPLGKSFLTDQPPTSDWDNLRAIRDGLDALLVQEYMSFLPPKSLNYPTEAKMHGLHASDRLAQWFDKHSTYISSSTSSPISSLSSNDDNSYLLPQTIFKPSPDMAFISLYHNAALIMLSTRHATNETVFDAFTPLFKKIVHLAAVYVKTFTTAASFTLDIAIVPVLYYVATKCREYGIRHAALKILRASRRTEGIWDSAATTRLAEEIIGFEEDRERVGEHRVRDVEMVMLDGNTRSGTWDSAVPAWVPEGNFSMEEESLDDGVSGLAFGTCDLFTDEHGEDKSRYVRPERRIRSVQTETHFETREIVAKFLHRNGDAWAWSEERRIRW
ncbi:hypothetical protein B0J11DRAFT_464987 [Dendryphion nanum]|uniref:Zn(2)-C6 fungal-type domain-containing protein n=1 Tax=Dendryphion nanum TaxID=256645 RepID=A0A9P9DNR2_9PLEO|nr:hypothetical protein B0J11DRAFT_464987 [Dendryphion nanum]